MVLLGIGNADVLLGRFDELRPQLFLEVPTGPVDFGLLQVLVELELVELLLLELLEGVLNGLLGF